MCVEVLKQANTSSIYTTRRKTSGFMIKYECEHTANRAEDPDREYVQSLTLHRLSDLHTNFLKKKCVNRLFKSWFDILY